MQIQKVFRAGNSEVVSIPLEVKKKTGIKMGTKVLVDVSSDGKNIVITKLGRKKKVSSITPEFFDWLETFNKEYGPTLKELAKKWDIEKASSWLKKNSRKNS